MATTANNTGSTGSNNSLAHGDQKALFLGSLLFTILLMVVWLILTPAKITPFIIGQGEGINAHVTYDQAIDLAEQNNIPIVLGKRWDGPRLTYDGARALKDTLYANQVTVLVKPYDYFDVDGVRHPASISFVGDDGLTLEQREALAADSR